MKKLTVVFLVSFLLFSCQSNSGTSSGSSINSTNTDAPSKLAFKGYELYTWMDNCKQVFALLEGTNREKNPDEISNAKTDYETIKKRISTFAKGEFVVLIFAGRYQSLPPAQLSKEMEEELKKLCSEKGINLNIAR